MAICLKCIGILHRNCWPNYLEFGNFGIPKKVDETVPVAISSVEATPIKKGYVTIHSLFPPGRWQKVIFINRLISILITSCSQFNNHHQMFYAAHSFNFLRFPSISVEGKIHSKIIIFIEFIFNLII